MKAMSQKESTKAMTMSEMLLQNERKNEQSTEKKRILPSWIQMRYLNSPHGVVGPLPDPVRHRAILLQLLAQLALDDKRLVGTLHRGVSNSRSLLFHIGIL